MQESCRLLVKLFDVEAAWVGYFNEEKRNVLPTAADRIELARLPLLTTQNKTASVQHPAWSL